MSHPDSQVSAEAALALLEHGGLSVTGRLTDASNVSLVGTVELDGLAIECIYKPIRGERPLWDFPDGTLADREVTAYRISKAAGWDCVPPTLLRDGPFGPGMVQQWVDATDYDELVDLLPAKKLPAGWLPVLRARDEDGHPLVLAHADDQRLATLAGFDLVVNNADRKASHILPTADGRVLGVDHGLTMHSEEKVRSILWGFAGRALPNVVVEGLQRLRADRAGLAELTSGFTAPERAAARRRIGRLLDLGEFPPPPRDRTPIPWPPL